MEFGLEGLVEARPTEVFEERLRAHYPEHQIFHGIPEEKGYTHEGKRYMWIFDPIDGVANFLAGIPVWGASLALLENFWPVFGVFHMPATGDFFHAQAGQQAFRGQEPIRISPQDEINDESVLLTYSRFHQHYRSDFTGKIRNLGCTAAHICYVAMGRAEAAFIANESYQDLAAPCLIVEAAGGKIYNLDGSLFSLNEYLDGERRGDHFLVAAPEIYSQARESIRPLS